MGTNKFIERTVIPDILKIVSFTKNLHYYSYAEHMSEEFFPQSGYKYKVIVDLKSESYFKHLLKKVPSPTTLQYSNIVYLLARTKNNIELLYTQRLYPYGRLWAHITEGKDRLMFYINPLYFYGIRLRIENILPPGIHLRNLTYLMLLKNGILSLYASSFALNEKEGCLILSPPNVGKSVTVSNAAQDGMFYLSEDISIVKNGYIYSVPYTNTYSHRLSKMKYLGPISYFFPSTTPFSSKFKDNILPKSRLKYIFILEPSSTNEITTIPLEVAIRKIQLLNEIEFNYHCDRIILSRFYLLNEDISDTKKIERDIIEKIIKQANIFLVKAKNPQHYYQLIKSVII